MRLNAASRCCGKFVLDYPPNGLRKETVVTSRQVPDSETIPESMAWDQQKIAFAWHHKDADGVSFRRRVEDDSLYLLKMSVQRRENESIEALFKKSFLEGSIVRDDFPARTCAAGRGNNPLGDGIFRLHSIEEMPCPRVICNGTKMW